ncbi:hypothetical protein F6816_03405 [Salmonella enterica]|nr:hypothetical protein [Salmonella enterica]ECY2606790.1 hypothetical protein [Salmonella enterica]ECY2770031.1 hypothetical protein [Salmonella enterica]ECZ5974149.1 hypothetical protein [Salmonella enterica]
MLRRGLSKDEMDNMPVPMFWSLHIFDTYLEPQSPQFQDLQNAMLQYCMYMTSPGMSREAAKSLKPSQFQLIKDEKIFKTKEELEAIERQREEERKAAMMSMFDPAKLEELRAIME